MAGSKTKPIPGVESRYLNVYLQGGSIFLGDPYASRTGADEEALESDETRALVLRVDTCVDVEQP